MHNLYSPKIVHEQAFYMESVGGGDSAQLPSWPAPICRTRSSDMCVKMFDRSVSLLDLPDSFVRNHNSKSRGTKRGAGKKNVCVSFFLLLVLLVVLVSLLTSLSQAFFPTQGSNN